MGKIRCNLMKMTRIIFGVIQVVAKTNKIFLCPMVGGGGNKFYLLFDYI